MFDLAVKNGKVWQNNAFVETNVYIKGSRIELIDSRDCEAKKTIEASDRKVIPGIIDPHVHFELNIGKYTSADDFHNGSAVGLFGGVTTFIDFLDPVYKGEQIETAYQTRLALAQKSQSDFSFHVTAANPVSETESIVSEALAKGLPSVKIFTAYSESNRRTYEAEIAELLSLSEERDFVLLVHAEDETLIRHKDTYSFRELPLSRPPQSEVFQIQKLAELVRTHRGTLYIVHTNCGESLKLLSEDYPEILHSHLFLESCPQYFYFNDQAFRGDSGFRYVLAPPLRPEHQRQELIARFDEIDSIGTDHCPFLASEKEHHLLKDIPFGIGGIEYSFPLMFSLFGEKVINKMTKRPSEIFGLAPRKGSLIPGADADLFLFNDSQAGIIRENHSQCDYNLYKHRPVAGKVETTILRGQIVMDKGEVNHNKGEFLPRRKET